MSTTRISKQQPIASIGTAPPVRVVKVGLAVREEKIPPTPYARKFVDREGNVVTVVLATGRTIRGTVENPYGNQMWAEKLAKGWLPYGECPVLHGHLRDEKVCDGIDPQRPGIYYVAKGRGFVEDQCCRHVEEAITLRQGENLARNAERARDYQGDVAKLVEIMTAQAARESAMVSPEQQHAAIFGTAAVTETKGRRLDE